ncbi:hypothetical protein F0Z19_1169 [Vibrio cyclitrophicus]|nr:hypothetical protein F0Z19_1169 [Vibrio cyclitrophicus]
MINIVFLTRLSMQNAGNEALSSELLKLFENRQDVAVRAFDRYPQYFFKYELNSISGVQEQELIAKFDNICTALLNKYSDNDFVLQEHENVVSLNKKGKELTGELRKLKQKIALRKRLAKVGLLGKNDVKTVVNTVLKSDQLIWNPAGEIHPTGSVDEVFRILILIRLAQLAGKKTYVINHSLELFDKSLTVILGYVYRNCNKILVRDHVSVKETAKIGVNNSNVLEVPDAVFLTVDEEGNKAKAKAKGICLAINGLEAVHASEAQWNSFFTRLKKFNKPIYFLSNAMNHDMKFAMQYAQKYDIQVIEHQPGYKEIQYFYKDFDVLISSRLHSAILALAESVPVVSIEPSVFKLTSIFDQINYPLKTVNLNDDSWVDKTINNVALSLEDSKLFSQVPQNLKIIKHSVISGYEEMFSS